MANTLSTVEQHDTLDVKPIEYAFIDVIHSYVKFLQAISYRIINNSNEVLRDQKKLCAITKELLKFLVAHKKFYLFEKIQLLSKDDGGVLFQKNLNYCDEGENFLKEEELVELANEFLQSDSPTELEYTVNQQDDDKILATVNKVRGTPVITNEDILQFLENNFLAAQMNLRNNCSSYKELEAYIDSRIVSYNDRNISIEQINKMSFKFHRNAEDCEGKNSCEDCSADFEEDQVLHGLEEVYFQDETEFDPTAHELSKFPPNFSREDEEALEFEQNVLIPSLAKSVTESTSMWEIPMLPKEKNPFADNNLN